MRVVSDNSGSSHLLAGAAPGYGPTLEPTVHYFHERGTCGVPPGQVFVPGIIHGTLLFGGLSPVLDKDCLRWRGGTHVLNCLGATRPSDSGSYPDANYAQAIGARAGNDGIEYMDWCINRIRCRVNYLGTFARLAQGLEDPGTCLYVHCKSGRDRSVMTLFALMRTEFTMSSAAAKSVLEVSRKGSDEWPCARVSYKGDIMDWIDAILSR